MIAPNNYNKINKNNSRPQLVCPHCKVTNLKIRSSEQRHPLLKDVWLTCPNLFCGFTCGGHIEKIHIPTLLELKSANDENWEEKND